MRTPQYDPNEEWVAEGAPPAFLAAVEKTAAELVRMAEALYLDGSSYTGGPLPIEQVTAGGGIIVYAIHPRLERVFILRVIPNP
jgi:hypothetical protein